MFGLKDNSKKPGDEFHFELEQELNDPKKHKALVKKVESKIQDLKKVLRDGEDKKDFERLALVLHGYTALLKVFSRFEASKS